MKAKRVAIHVVLIDDHHLLRLGVANLFINCNDFKIVGEAPDGLTGLRIIKKECPDIVILDITMEGLSGLDMIQPIRSMEPRIRIIIYSMHDDPQFIGQAMKTGSSGYVLKSDPMEELIKAARAVHGNQTYLSSTVTTRLVNSMITAETDEAKDMPLTVNYPSLSPREKEVSSFIAKGYNTRQIAEVLFISPQTVRVHRANIMKKLPCNTSSELTVLLRDLMYSSNK